MSEIIRSNDYEVPLKIFKDLLKTLHESKYKKFIYPKKNFKKMMDYGFCFKYKDDCTLTVFGVNLNDSAIGKTVEKHCASMTHRNYDVSKYTDATPLMMLSTGAFCTTGMLQGLIDLVNLQENSKVKPLTLSDKAAIIEITKNVTKPSEPINAYTRQGVRQIKFEQSPAPNGGFSYRSVKNDGNSDSNLPPEDFTYVFFPATTILYLLSLIPDAKKPVSEKKLIFDRTLIKTRYANKPFYTLYASPCFERGASILADYGAGDPPPTGGGISIPPGSAG